VRLQSGQFRACQFAACQDIHWLRLPAQPPMSADAVFSASLSPAAEASCPYFHSFHARFFLSALSPHFSHSSIARVPFSHFFEFQVA